MKDKPDHGTLYVIAAPSGTGKTTLVKALTDSLPQITVSISHTTRPKRSNEVNGVNYYFVEKTEFEHMVAHHDFLEHAEIFDYQYGTSKSWVEKTLAEGMDVILEIDWQGHQQIKKLFPHSVSIFILPPSMEDLRNRLCNRNQDSQDVIKKRLADAQTAASHMNEFDFLVINDEFSHAVHDLTCIVVAERLRKHRQVVKFSELINKLEHLN
jgi:guanylate kinase